MSQLYTADEAQIIDEEYMDYYNTCMDDRDDEGNGSCPDCGTMFEIHNETTAEHKIVQRFECPKCGTESEAI